MDLEFSHVTAKKKGFVLKDITFSVPEGFITGLVGENGAGKTTLFSLVMEEYACYEGDILAGGMVLAENRREIMQKVGFISREQQFFQNFNGMQNADFLAGFYREFNRDCFIEKMKEFGVSLGTPLKGLSAGEFIKFQLAFALSHGSRLFLLDEATAGMDPVYKKDFFRLIHEMISREDTAVLMSTHIEEEVTRHMDYVVRISKGAIESVKEAGEWKP